MILLRRTCLCGWLLVTLLSLSCRPLIKPPYWKCHKAIAMETYARTDCVIYEAIVRDTEEMIAAGLRPTHVRVGFMVPSILKGEGAIERHKISGGWTRWVDVGCCKLKVVREDSFEQWQFKVEGYKPHDEPSEVRSVPSTPTRQLDEVSF